jgi:tetratricopeptide (TPR) repeat protein
VRLQGDATNPEGETHEQQSHLEQSLPEAQAPARNASNVVVSTDLDIESLFEHCLDEIRNGTIAAAVATLTKTHDVLAKELDSYEAQRIPRKQLDESVRVADIAAIQGYLVVGNLEEAALQSNLALLAFPGRPELLALEAEILEKIERSGHLDPLLSQAEQHRRRRQWEKAIEAYKAAIDLDPGNATVRKQMAQVYAAWAADLPPANRKSALTLLETGLTLDASNTEILELRSKLLQSLTTENVDRAINRARELQSKGELLQAESELKRVLEEAPENSALHDYLKELSDLRKQERDRNEIQTIEERVRRLTSERNYTEAESVLLRALKEFPDSEPLQTLLVLVRDRFAAQIAESALSRIVALDSQGTISALKEALRLADDGIRQVGPHPLLLKARNRLEKRVNEREDKLQTVLTQVEVQISKGDYENAKDGLRNASDLDPENVQLSELKTQLNKARVSNLFSWVSQKVAAPQPKDNRSQTNSEIQFQPGAVLADRYEIVAHLGTGGMSTVYKARDLLAGQMIAIKIVLPLISRQPELREKFKQELLVARKLTHPSVVRIYDIGEHQGLLFISMELIEGKTVTETLAERKRFTVDQFMALFRQFTSALAYIHSQKVVHRDIKPHNLMYGKDGNLKVMDFGIARDMASDLTTNSVVVGTPLYMSPEMLEGAPISAASDIYSAGTMFYELLTGTRPFQHGTLHERQTKQIPRVSTVVPDIPRDLDEMIHHCLQFRPNDRFQSVDEMVASISAVRPPSTQTGGTLADLNLDDPRPPIEAVPVFIKAVQQLAAIHKQGSGRPILAPQTIRVVQNDVQFKTVGTVEPHSTRAIDCKYASFEEFGDSTAGGGHRAESDIYVLGFVFYEIFLGKKLFSTRFGELGEKGQSDLQWLNWHSDPGKSAVPLKQILHDFPALLSDTVEGMMQKVAERRPALSAVEASLKSVQEHLKRETIKTVILNRQPQPQAQQKIAPPKSSKTAVFISVALLLAALLAVAAWFALHAN